MSNKIWGIVLAVSLMLAGVAGFNVVKLYGEYQRGINEYKELEEYVTVEVSDQAASVEMVATDTETDEEEQESVIPVKVDVRYEVLKSINDDFVSWIYYEPLEISYPVVRGNDNDYYTGYTFEGEKNSSGAIFMDFLNKPDYSNYNTIIYGHNMRNGTMFGSLKTLLSDEEIVKGDPYFYVFTEDKAYMYEIFAVYITDASSHTYDLIEDEEGQQTYLEYVNKTATYRSEREVTASDRIVTLSTCHGLHSNNRTVVHGVLIAEEER